MEVIPSAIMGGRFGALITSRREQRGLKAFELAAQMKRPASFVSRLETETFKEMPPPNVLADLEAALGLSQAEMLAALGYDVGLPVVPPESAEFERLHALIRALPPDKLDPLIGLAEYLLKREQAQTPHAPPENHRTPAGRR